MWPFVPNRFVRREKEIAETRREVAEVETLRYKQRMEYLEGELKELQDSLNVEREKLQVLKAVLNSFPKLFPHMLLVGQTESSTRDFFPTVFLYIYFLY